MITSRILQAADAAINELTMSHPDEADVDEALALIGIGPRALSFFIEDYIERFGDDPGTGMLFAFLHGVLSDRLVAVLQSDDDTLIEAVEDLFSDEPAYEGAQLGDIQDLLHVTFGVVTDDEIDPEALIDLTLQTVLGIDKSALLNEDEPQWDPIDPDLAEPTR